MQHIEATYSTTLQAKKQQSSRIKEIGWDLCVSICADPRPVFWFLAVTDDDRQGHGSHSGLFAGLCVNTLDVTADRLRLS
jgi:hypothetical protein